jgi:hypothetical protein
MESGDALYLCDWGSYPAEDPGRFEQKENGIMADSVYKIIEIVGTSTEGWDKAAAAAVTRAGESLRDIRVAEVTDLDLTVSGGSIVYRAKMKVSFKYEE